MHFHQWKRRQVLTLLGGAAAWPLGPRRHPGFPPRVGYLVTAAPDDQGAHARHSAFRDALEGLGWSDGRTIRIDYRWDIRGPERVQAAVAELISLGPRVILSEGSPATQALQRETRTIPIVFVAASDPLSSGLVTSMARPGGNVTGFTNYEFPMGAKWLEVLKQVAPTVRRVLVLVSLPNPGQEGFLRELEAGAATLGVQPTSASVADASEIERAINRFAEQPNGGLVMLPGGAAMFHPD